MNKGKRKYEEYLNKCCTECIFLVVMMCMTLLSTKWSLIILKLPYLVFRISLLLIEICVYTFWLWNLFINFNSKSGILETKRKYDGKYCR